jgi:hypothetical protein
MLDLDRYTHALDCFSKSIEIKRDFLLDLPKKDYTYSRIKGSISVDLRKLHDIGPHLCSKSALEIASSQNIGIDFSSLRNGTKTKKILGDEYILQLEHVFPVDQVISLMLMTSKGEPLKSLIKETSCTAWIMESEDKQIQEKSFRSSPCQSYANAGIRLLEKVDNKWVDFDWSYIERLTTNSI